MQRSTAKRRIVTMAPIPAIVIRGVASHEEGSRCGFLLVVFMRLLAALWMFEGLLQWSAVLLPGSDGADAWSTLSDVAVVAVVFFAVIDLTACVGLWLAAPWGGVIWLVSVGAQVFVTLLIPDFFAHPALMVAADLILVAVYLGLTGLAVRGAEPGALAS